MDATGAITSWFLWISKKRRFSDSRNLLNIWSYEYLKRAATLLILSARPWNKLYYSVGELWMPPVLLYILIFANF